MPYLIVLLIALLLPLPVTGQTPTQAMESTLTVTGTGTIRREPDRALLQLAVESFAPTAQAAAAENTRRMEALITALRRQGLTGEDVRTTSYELFPEYDYRQDTPRESAEPRLLGFRARNSVQVTIDGVARVGGIIDAAITAGANRVTGLFFQLRDPQAARNDALREAVAAARSEAEAVAAALGRPLGPAISVSTSGFFPAPRPQPVAMARMDTAMEATPIEPGALEVGATVTIVYLLADPG